MNHSVPDWYMEDNSRSSRKKSPAPENELVELLWRNGHVVMQSQSNRKPPSTAPESRQEPKLDPSTKYGCTSVGNLSSGLIQDDGPSSWLQYSFDDPLEREFSEFFSGIPMEDTAVGTNKRNMDLLEEEEEGEGDVWFSVDEEANALCMPPPKFGSTQKAPAGLGNSGFVNVLSCSRPPMDDLGSRSGALAGIGESTSARTVGSSACGSSNQPDTGHDMSNGATEVRVSRAKDAQTNPINPTVTTSSSGSGCSFGRTAGQQSASNQNHKRKGRDCHSEEADYESIEANRPSQRSGSTRKSRAAEVHNLSERKRRDRINEKMKALQELIPHCNKADKASMLDEAIEYLKSLQLQLQIMWMGSGMAPMMFPIGMGHAPMPSINNPGQIQSPRVPLVNHSMPTPTASANQMPMRQSPVFNPISFPTQMQNARLPESLYARYVGVPHLQLVPQAMNLYAYGSHIVQQNQTAAAVGTCSLPTAGIPSEKIQNGQSG